MLLVLLCVAVLADRHDSGHRFENLDKAVREADKLIGQAEVVLAQNNLFPGQDDVFVGRHGGERLRFCCSAVWSIGWRCAHRLRCPFKRDRENVCRRKRLVCGTIQRLL
jgi:hypothetical protein